jgi:hypothetical protein
MAGDGRRMRKKGVILLLKKREKGRKMMALAAVEKLRREEVQGEPLTAAEWEELYALGRKCAEANGITKQSIREKVRKYRAAQNENCP